MHHQWTPPYSIVHRQYKYESVVLRTDNHKHSRKYIIVRHFFHYFIAHEMFVILSKDSDRPSSLPFQKHGYFFASDYFCHFTRFSSVGESVLSGLIITPRANIVTITTHLLRLEVGSPCSSASSYLFLYLIMCKREITVIYGEVCRPFAPKHMAEGSKKVKNTFYFYIRAVLMFWLLCVDIFFSVH